MLNHSCCQHTCITLNRVVDDTFSVVNKTNNRTSYISINICLENLKVGMLVTIRYIASKFAKQVDGLPYYRIVEEARQFIRAVGGFEKFAEWGLF